MELEEIPANHYSKFKINASLFTPETPKETEPEVFSEEEEKKFKALALKEFEEHPDRIAALAVIINFSLGLRVGELVALKWKDLIDSYLHIRRMEQKQFEKLENDKWQKSYTVVEHTKSDTGSGTLYVLTSAMELYNKASKTALTKIADNPNINLKDAIEWAGHRDVKTFITHYCFSLYSDEQKRNELEKTLNI